MKILVTGATGKVGSLLLKELMKRNVPVRALVRNADAKLPDGVEAAVGDLLDPIAVGKALDGMDKLYLLNGVVPDELTQGLIPFGLARKRKLKHIVYHSVFKAEHFTDVPHFASKVAIEQALKDFDVPYTVIRPNYFIQNDLMLQTMLVNFGVYTMPLGTPGLSVVDIRDIAEAAATVLTTEGHYDKTYNLNGPDVLSGTKAADIWSKALGKTVHYAGENMDQFEEEFRKFTPSWAAYDFRMMMEGYLERGFTGSAEDMATLTKLLGHAPRSYEAFVKETAALWNKK